MKVINIWTEFDIMKHSYRDDDGKLVIKAIPLAPKYTAFLPDGTMKTFQSWEERNFWFKDNPEALEADVQPVKRLMADKEIELQKPKRCYLDLETDSEAKDRLDPRILCWVIVGEDGTVEYGLLAEDTDDAEKDIIQRCWDALAKYDQVSAWYGGYAWDQKNKEVEGFDYPVLRNRSKRYRIHANRRLLYLDQLEVYKRFNVASQSGEEKASLKLEDVCQARLGKGKKEFDRMNTRKEWEAGGERRKALLEYCIQDTVLLKELEEKTRYIELFQQVCQLVHVLPDTFGLRPTSWVDGYMLRLGHLQNKHFPTKQYVESEKFKGAYVMMPKIISGENIRVCDFTSMYPTVMLTLNASPETVDPGHFDVCRAPTTNVLFDQSKKGLICQALEELLDSRAVFKKQLKKLKEGTVEYDQAERMSTALKVVANSFYGVVGSPYSRFFVKELAESVTGTSEFLIKQTIEHVEHLGGRVVYADTDGAFIEGLSHDELSRFVDFCNNILYPTLVHDWGGKVNYIKLAYDKCFTRIVFPVSDEGVACAKRYVGVKENGEAEIKGLEFKRRDATRYTRALQKQIIDLYVDGTLTENLAISIVENTRYNVMHNPLNIKDLITSKSVKDLGEYKEDTNTPHVALARKLKAEGKEIPGRLEYVVLDSAVSPMKVCLASEYAGVLDRRYYWNEVIFPATQRLLVGIFAGQNWNHWYLNRVRLTSEGQGTLWEM